MVRHGRLSKGCQVCRKRKIKCDQKLPACSQCVKAGWKCPQYADSVDRMFQYQPTRDSKSSLPATTIKSNLTDTHGTKVHELSLCKLPKQIIQPVQCRAIDFFLQTHTFQENGVIRGHYEYLPAFSHEITTDTQVVTSLTAVALAAYAYKFQYPELLDAARRQYVYSLRYMKDALSCHEKAVEDNTLISVLLLNTYEGLTCETKASLPHREAHLKGAMTILALRDRGLVRSRRGLQLFRQTSLCLTLSCLIHSLRVPAGLMDLHLVSAGYMDTGEPAWRLSDVMIKLAGFRADIREAVLCDPGNIIQAAGAIDAELLCLEGDMVAKMPFQTLSAAEKSDLVWDTYYHVYPDLWAAAAWNHVHSCRIVLHSEIKSQLETILATSPDSFSPADAQQYEQCRLTLQHLTSEICASMPQYCDYLPLLSDGTQQQPKARENEISYGNNQSSAIPTTAGIYQFFWPLLNAGQVTQSQSQRDWIIDRCRYMGRMSGIQQAYALAEILEDGTGMMC
ncbi:hypothetical protein BO70DRAFT_396430 [Aspergillus heteromorphus CBS 117.55]|uniref:Zn(2)-C6 fungal-type domain-containing protein n=1 Tax=Aspergillus heteromorphus CBS 117.55 TaxID=1448321 RepID=A0A317W6W6_9EURO|nr:uncharacterized protein BO70DRAFT_396430 [Aspergillus heteromorphus CBS 117.55]PWY82133.1 hypothetical protein BO70DRAFT_396430 [Aspergillus heteromorphus CBS 117.55]